MSTAHDKYVALQRHRNAAPLALDPRTTALVMWICICTTTSVTSLTA